MSGQGQHQESELRVTIRTELERTGAGEESVEEIHEFYKKQFSENINKLRIRVEFLSTNNINTTVYSQEIRSSKLSHVNFEKPNILKSCTHGYRQILLCSKV